MEGHKVLNLINRAGMEGITCFFFGKNLMNEESSVTGCIAIVENPILHTPQIWLLSPNLLPQMFQNISVELLIDSLDP